MRSSVEQLRGFAIVSAIFILVVLAALGAFMVSVSTSQQIGSALDVQGVRAYQAARAGIEWGLYTVQSTAGYNFGYASNDPNQRRCPGGGFVSTDSFNPGPEAATLSAFRVTVICTAVQDGSSGPTVFRIVATACNQPSGGACPNTTDPGQFYIERRIEVGL